MIKKCRHCGEEKTLSEFRKDRSNIDGYRYECKVCSRTYVRSKYTERYGERTRQRSKDRRLIFGEFLSNYKSSLGKCHVCSEDSLDIMEFHHLDPNEKDFGISDARALSLAKIERELDKCVMLCPNCHRKVHMNLLSIWS